MAPDPAVVGESCMALDADSGEIIARTMTDQHTGDVSQVEPLLDQIGPIGRFTADGALSRCVCWPG